MFLGIARVTKVKPEEHGRCLEAQIVVPDTALQSELALEEFGSGDWRSPFESRRYDPGKMLSEEDLEKP
jgi:hypothetical protein